MIGGPGCRAWRALTAGRHLVGRSPSCDLVIEDPTVELHHGILDTTGAAITFTQLTGRVPARLDGELCAVDQSIEPGRSLHLGASRIVFRGVGESSAGSHRRGGGGGDDRAGPSAASSRRSPTRGDGSCDVVLPDPKPDRRWWPPVPPLPPNTEPRRSPGSSVPQLPPPAPA